jgi:hypothetical protein
MTSTASNPGLRQRFITGFFVSSGVLGVVVVGTGFVFFVTVLRPVYNTTDRVKNVTDAANGA